MASPLARTVLITGSSRGLGLEMVRQLAVAENPPKVIIASCTNPDKATELQALAGEHQHIKVIKLDVLDYESLPRVVDEVKAAVGDNGLNLLVNNAGVADKYDKESVPQKKSDKPLLFGVPLEYMEPQEFRRVLETNTIAPLMVIKALLSQLKVAAAAGGPVGPSRAMVVNISSSLGSMGAYVPRPGLYAYRASKAALNMVSKSLVESSDIEGILCVSLHPGWVRTDMGSSAAPLSPYESVSQMLRVLRNVNEKQDGLLLSYDGSVIPY